MEGCFLAVKRLSNQSFSQEKKRLLFHKGSSGAGASGAAAAAAAVAAAAVLPSPLCSLHAPAGAHIRGRVHTVSTVCTRVDGTGAPARSCASAAGAPRRGTLTA